MFWFLDRINLRTLGFFLLGAKGLGNFGVVGLGEVRLRVELV